MKKAMIGVVCRFFKREDPERLAMITVYKTKVKRTAKRKVTTTKTETRTSKSRVVGQPIDSGGPSSSHRSADKPWDVENKEITGVSKDVSEQVVEEEELIAYEIVVENDRNRQN